MPRCDKTAPRNMFPPPTTAATWMPSRAAAETSLAMCTTASGEIPSGSPPAKASPESFSTTRCQGGCASPGTEILPAAARSTAPASSAGAVPLAAATSSAGVLFPGGLLACCTGRILPDGWPCGESSARSAGLPDLEPGKRLHAGTVLRQQLADRLLLVPYRRLLDEHDVLQERVHAAFHDLADGSLRLALLAGHLLGDPALILDDVRRHLVAGDVARPHRGDLVRYVLGHVSGSRLELDQHTEGRRQRGVGLVQVAGYVAALEPGKPADLHLLLERGTGLLDELLGGLAGPDLQAEHAQPVRGVRGQRRLRDVGRHLLEELGLRDKVGLAVELEEHALAVPLECGGDQSLGRGALGPLGNVLGPLDPQEFHCGLVVRGLDERIPAVEHARARLLTEPLYIRCAVFHVLISISHAVVAANSPTSRRAALRIPGQADSGAGSADSAGASSVTAALSVAVTSAAGAAAVALSAGAASVAAVAVSAGAASVATVAVSAGAASVAAVAVSAGAASVAAGAVSGDTVSVAAAGVPLVAAVPFPSAGLPSSSARSHSASGSSVPSTPSAGAAGFSSPAAAPARAIRPSATASATTLVRSATLRIASSFPGIG